MGWNVNLPPAEWFAPEPPGPNSRWTYKEPWRFNIDGLIREVCDQREVSIDTETTGLNIVKDVPLFWSMSWGRGSRCRRVCMPASTLPYFTDAFGDRDKRWIFANAKYDMHILANVGINLVGECCDTQVMHALLYEESPHALKEMARELLGWKWTEFKDTFGLSEKKEGAVQNALLTAERENLPLLVEYASNDAYGTLEIYYKLKEELENTQTFSLYPSEFQTMADIFFKVEMPYTKVLWKMERRGITIDAEYLNRISGPCAQGIKDVEREIVRLAGRMINPNSPTQLRQIFFDELRLKPTTYTKGGKKGIKEPSVDANFLEHYKHEVPLAKALLTQRELTKLKGTYIDGLQACMDQHNRIHTRFNQDVARTGRLSSANPNLQNIPTPENDQFKIRGAFIPKSGCDLIVVDYSALEMRLLAAAARDPLMTQIFLDKKDIHMGNAEMVFGRKIGMDYAEILAAKKMDGKVKAGLAAPEEMTERMHLAMRFRRHIKSVSFGLNYGMQSALLARNLGVSQEEAEEVMAEYMGTYPAVQEFFQAAKERAAMTGFSFTVIGRRRYHPGILSSRPADRNEDERKAVNNEIQGSAADVVRWAQLMLDASGIEHEYGCDMLLQVHDELVFECPKENTEKVLPIIRHCMEHPFYTDLDVPLEVSMGTGENWMNAK